MRSGAVRFAVNAAAAVGLTLLRPAETAEQRHTQARFFRPVQPEPGQGVRGSCIVSRSAFSTRHGPVSGHTTPVLFGQQMYQTVWIDKLGSVGLSALFVG